MESKEKRELGDEYFADLRAKRKPMSQVMKGSNWFKELSGKLAKRVLSDAEKAGVPDDERKAKRKRMVNWFKILVAYRKDIDDVTRDPKISPDFRRDLLITMRQNLYEIRVKMFGE